MELYKMIFQRLVNDDTLEELLASYNDRPAVFYQHPATSDDPEWGKVQYPRIDYIVDMQENPARNTSGVLMVNIWCDSEYGTEPESIEKAVRDLLHATFAQTDDYPYCFAWVRSDTFDGSTDKEKDIHTIGVTVVFDLIACPSQYTIYPDPIKGLNEWTHSVLPDAVVIGRDEIDGWLVPTRERPVIYWRLTAQGKAQQHFAWTWLDISVECHVYCRSAADRLYNLVQLNTAHALTGHITLEDTSPLFLKTFNLQPHMNYIATGQIRATGYFGILQPESHLSNKGTGYKLNNPIYWREKITSDEDVIAVNGSTSQAHPFTYPAASESAEAGTIPETSTSGAAASSSAGVSSSMRGYVKTYDAASKKKYTKS
jgi:hypothetical protein